MPLFGKRKPRNARPHPYADEITSDAEKDPAIFAIKWFLLATGVVALGFLLNHQYSNHYGGGASNWLEMSYLPLFIGLLLIGTHFFKTTWSHHTTMVGWVVFGFYWALVAMDQSDIANFLFASIGAYLSNYIAYHEWLDLKRGVRTLATKFLATATFIAAGTYFLIAAISPFRIGLINIVGNHTKWMLDLFGAGDEKGLVFVVDKQDILGPVTFFYPETYCNPHRSDEVGAYCEENGYGVVTSYPAEPTNWFESLLQYTTDPSADALRIIPVSIILACTAIQSIMLFVGLFYGTTADWKKKLTFSLVIGGLIYVLNLLRNTIIIWFYGLGHASFWFIHDIVGKGLSLAALIGIAAVAFRKFPEFFEALASVLDTIHRDGPLERAFRIGRRRPNADGSPRVEQHFLRREPAMVAFVSLITLNFYGWKWSKEWLKRLDNKWFEAKRTLISLTMILFFGGWGLFVYGSFQILDWSDVNTWETFRAETNLFYGAIALAGFQVLLAVQLAKLASLAKSNEMVAYASAVVPILAPVSLYLSQKNLEASTNWETGTFAPKLVKDTASQSDGSIREA
ncbi:MAG: hypothetical protein ACPHK8_02035 [Thermoplasmatota archaeon]